MKKYQLLILLTFQGLFLKSQSINDLKNSYFNNIKSPQVTDFIRYGNIPIKKNVGELDLSVPLLSIPAGNGDDIKLSLSYNASGFIPSKKSGIVGFNWNLMAGGMITREVKGEMDEQLGSPQTLGGMHGHNEHGYMAGIRQFSGNPSLLPTDNDLLSYAPSKLTVNIDTDASRFYEVRLKGYPDNNTTPYETTPDMFSFNFNGISGKFFMAPDGNIEVITSEPHKLKVDFSGFNLQPYTASCTPLYKSDIKITDEKGNIYSFGGESKNLEYVNSSSNPKEYPSSPVITTWYLTKVELANNDIIYYDYLDDLVKFTNTVDFCTSQGLFWHGLYNELKKFIEFNVSNSMFDQGASISSRTNTTIHFSGDILGYANSFSLTKKAYLGSIRYKDYKINFVYSDQDNLYKNLQTAPFSVPGYASFNQKKLDAVELYSNTNLVNKFNLNYETYGTVYPRIFLKSVQEKGKEPYTFNYDTSNVNNIPVPYTAAVDYWGFYNGKLINDPNGTIVKSVPETDYYVNGGDFQYTTDNREPNFNFSKIFALASMVYPTKGTSRFLYEPHQYGLRLERRVINNFIPSLFDVTGIAGGTRIKTITDNDGSSDLVSRNFNYGDASSPGILLDWPRFIFYLKSITNFGVGAIHWTANEELTYTNTSSVSRNTLENSIICYPQVTETQSNKGSVTEYYTTYLDRPDTFNSNISKLTGGDFLPMPSTQNIFLIPNDVSIERGKLKQRLIKDNNGNLLEETNILYNEDPLRFNKFHVSMNLSNAWANTLRTYYYNNFISSSITKKYFGSNVLKDETNYFYENPSHNMLTKSITKYSDNSIMQTTYQYANEKNNQLMINKNMVGIPLETTTIQTDNGVTKTLSRVEAIYPTSLPTPEGGNLILPLSIKSYSLDNNPSTEVTYNQYDLKGNVQQYTTKDGVPVTIIWGYNSTQPIARIEGAKLSDITPSLIPSIVNASNDDNNPPQGTTPDQTEQNLILALDTFRKNSSLSAFQVTTYTYDPLIGVTSINPPSGIREVYIYDTANRLKEIRQQEKDSSGNMVYKVVKEFKYNYKN